MSTKFDAYRGSITSRLEDLGYYVVWHQLDVADYGVPQHRHRVFCLGFLDRAAFGAFRLPPTTLKHRTVGDVIFMNRA